MKIYDVGIAFGAFDPLHYGHINLFRRAKTRCKTLIVSVNPPEYIRAKKGRAEFLPLAERMEQLAWAEDVDIVTTHATKRAAIDNLKPDVIIVGDDWKGKDWDGAKLGRPVIYLPYTPEINSTMIREEFYGQTTGVES